jgi:hypothetical protein
MKSLTISLVLNCLLILASCSKKSADVAPVEIPERLELSPAVKSIVIGDVTSFNAVFYDKLGKVIATPQNISWSSSKVNIATISSTGAITGIGSGQTTIKATYNDIEATALLTVVANNNEVATVTIEAVKEINLNQSTVLQAVVKNNLGQVLQGLTVSWQSDNVNLVEVTQTGIIKGISYGTANVKATVEGIQSNSTMVQVIRSGTFGSGGTGTAKLKIENNILKLQTSSNFSVSTSPPDLRVFLTNSSTNITGAVEVASLTQKTGEQTWNLPANVSITQYRYVMVWCKQFGGVYGLADLGL